MTEEKKARLAALLEEMGWILNEPDRDIPEIGVFGKFWDGNEPDDSDAVWFYLKKYATGKAYPYKATDGCGYEHFRPGLPKEKI